MKHLRRSKKGNERRERILTWLRKQPELEFISDTELLSWINMALEEDITYWQLKQLRKELNWSRPPTRATRISEHASQKTKKLLRKLEILQRENLRQQKRLYLMAGYIKQTIEVFESE